MTNTILHPWHLMVTIMAGMVNREQQQTIEYLRTENPGAQGETRQEKDHAQ
jgi:hypothetical protein